MKIYHEYRGCYHEVDFKKADIIKEESLKSVMTTETLRNLFSGPGGSREYKSIPIIDSFVICLICGEKILIKSEDKEKGKNE